MGAPAYPIRLDISRPGQPVVVAPPRGGSGNPVRLDIATPGVVRAFPGRSEEPKTAHGFGQYIARKAADFGSVLGNALHMTAATNPATIPYEVLSHQSNRVAIRDFIDGLMGNPKGGARTPVQPAAAPTSLDQATAAQAARVALAAGRGAQNPITPQDRVAAFIDSQFQGPLTMREAAAFSGMLPDVATARAASGKGPKAKDTVLGQTAQLSQEIYQNQIDQAKALMATDPEGARAATEKATQDYFNRQAGLVGFNPTNLAQAALMAGADEEN